MHDTLKFLSHVWQTLLSWQTQFSWYHQFLSHAWQTPEFPCKKLKCYNELCTSKPCMTNSVFQLCRTNSTVTVPCMKCSEFLNHAWPRWVCKPSITNSAFIYHAKKKDKLTYANCRNINIHNRSLHLSIPVL